MIFSQTVSLCFFFLFFQKFNPGRLLPLYSFLVCLGLWLEHSLGFSRLPIFPPGQGTSPKEEPQLGTRAAWRRPTARPIVCRPLVAAAGTVATWLPLGQALPSAHRIGFSPEGSQGRRPGPHLCVLLSQSQRLPDSQ